jgi:hypothetical protein
MLRSRTSRSRALVLAVAAAVAATTVAVAAPSGPAPAAAAEGAEESARPDPQEPQRSEQAEQALEQVREQAPGRGQQPGPGPRGKQGQQPAPPGEDVERTDPEAVDMTMALRDLALYHDALDPAEEAEARRYLKRPSDGDQADLDGYPDPSALRTACSDRICVHWVPPTGANRTYGATDDYAEESLQRVTAAFDRFTAMGYRRPLPDGTKGGDNKTDVYLTDLAGQYFGYAASDDSRAWDGIHRGVNGYLVIDNDYREFCAPACGTAQAEKFRDATLAHEFFHLVQYGYDWWEDLWFMEATATWAEDEVFDDINDNVNFLHAGGGPFTAPRVPMDGENANPYGWWLFFRYLSERYSPSIVRQMWEKADAWKSTAPDRYSLSAVRATVTQRGGSWNDVWRRFADANRRPARTYDEAVSAGYPHSRPYQAHRLTHDRRARTSQVTLNRLTSASFRYAPEQAMKRNWKLRIKVDGVRPSWGGSAIATYATADGSIRRVPFNLNGAGDITKWLPFGTSKVRWVEVTVVNASTRYKCWQYTQTSCEGISRDSRRTTKLVVTAVRPN